MLSQQRSFATILSPSLPHSPGQDEPAGRPFVYSREFLLSLYDHHKATSQRPIELASHEIATKGTGEGKRPWALQDFRNGEKELFTNSIHPPSTRRTNSTNTTNSNSNTLDLSTLPTLPRERDRALASPGATKDSTPARRGRLGGLGGSNSGVGIMGGVLGGIAGVGGVSNGRQRPASPSAGKKEAPATPGARESGTYANGGGSGSNGTGTPGSGAKEVWQGGRWRRGAGDEDADKEKTRPSAFGARRFPTSDTLDAQSPSAEAVPDTWDSSPSASPTPAAQRIPTPPLTSQSQAEQDQLSLSPTYNHATSILGSLSLDTLDDPLLPPGLPAAQPSPQPPVETNWVYRDPSGVVQGPFANTMMHDWYRQKFFMNDLMVKRVNEPDFETLESLIRRSGDAESPFLSSPPQPAPLPPPISNPITNGWGVPSPALQSPFGGVSGAGFFGQQQQLPVQPQQPFGGYGDRRNASGGLDPWGAPLPSLPATGGWANGYQQPQQQQIPQPQAFSQPQQPFSHSPVPDWARLNSLPLSNSPHLQSALPQQPPQPQQPQGGWSSLIGSSLLDLPTAAPSPVVPSPIGPPAPQQQSVWETPKPVELASPAVLPAPAPAPVQPASIASPVQAAPVAPTPAAALPSPTAAPASAPASTPAPVPAPVSVPVKQPEPEPTPVVEEPAPAPAPAAAATPVTPPPQPSTPAPVAPWVKEEDATVTRSLSLREIQEAEARQSEARKLAERQALARAQALANVKEAQRLAQEEKESLPSSSTWGASGSEEKEKKPAAPAPWLKGAASSGTQKTLKEIQEEEERRKEEVLRKEKEKSVGRAAATGYAGSIGTAAPVKAAGAPWTTIAVKPAPVPVVPVARPVVPGGPLIAPTTRASLPAKPAASPVARPAVVVPARASPGPVKYDAEHPPPPSSEFMKWCREALTGLTVPMEEFIQMLLSFPLEASADVLEIISDSVYANSSTLDGRRFANDFSSRRKLDVAARYPNIVMSKPKPVAGGKPTSMADALKSVPVQKAPEWQVRVAGGKKKKGGK
ncbi:GYF domain containing protein [Pseudohyphozyma bogoriensis]|nr:GYF domain containing protein [Pseudohyphozyma bogoriensis]